MKDLKLSRVCKSFLKFRNFFEKCLNRIWNLLKLVREVSQIVFKEKCWDFLNFFFVDEFLNWNWRVVKREVSIAIFKQNGNDVFSKRVCVVYVCVCATFHRKNNRSIIIIIFFFSQSVFESPNGGSLGAQVICTNFFFILFSKREIKIINHCGLSIAYGAALSSCNSDYGGAPIDNAFFFETLLLQLDIKKKKNHLLLLLRPSSIYLSSETLSFSFSHVSCILSI